MILHFIRTKKMKTDAEASLALAGGTPGSEAQEDFSNDALFETLKGFGSGKRI